ncbi:hypothetical protein [uncultured Mediterranean phage uvMED]|nr:hypothetical protein [uncultured Mediterranean phage uvMED]
MPGHYGHSHSNKSTKTGGGGNRPNPHTDSGLSKSTPVSKGALERNKKAMDKVKANQGRDALSNYQVKKLPPTGIIPLVLNAAQGLRQKGFEVNRKFYREKVLTSKNRGGYVDTLDSYSDYMKARGAGTIDAYGNQIGSNGGGADNTVLSQEPTSGVVTSDGVVAPGTIVKTKEEIQEEKNKESGIILAKKRGRSEMIKTSSTGLEDEDDLIMKKTLLG